MPTLPFGFSPVNAVKQVGDWAGVYGDNSKGANYDVFSEIDTGNNNTPQVQGASIDGAMWYDAQSGLFKDQNGNPVANAQGGVQQPTGSSNRYTAPDPYARWGGKSGYDAKVNNYQTTQGGYRTGAQTDLRDVKNEYNTKTNTFINGLTDSQNAINQGQAQNQLNLRTSMSDIIKGLQTGLRSGNVALANMNAMDSGASEAMARAYGQVGESQAGEARGQAAEQFAELQRQQGVLNRDRDTGLTELDTWADTETDRVKNDLSTKLQLLEADAVSNGMGGQVDLSMVDQVLGEALTQLENIDKTRNQRLSGVKSLTPDEIVQRALQMEQAGEVGNAFGVTGPTVNYGRGGGGVGAPLPGVPLFVKNRDKLSTVPGLAKGKEK